MLQRARWGHRQTWERVAPVLLALVLVVVLAYVIARTVWLIGYGPSDPVLESGLPHIQIAGDQQVETGLSQSQVDGWQLFGAYNSKVAAQQKDEVDAPETRLQLLLLGLFLSPDADRSSAIIAQKGQDAGLYHIGDDIPGNAKLENIYADRIILRRQGRLETLRLSSLGTLNGVAQVSQSASTLPASAQPASNQSVPAQPVSTQTVSNPQAEFTKQRGVLIDRLGLKPVTKGASDGYTIGPQAPVSLIQQLGLKPGDVIVSVNGHPLGNKESDLAAMQSYQSTRKATIVIDRGDQQFTVSYPP